MSDMGLLVSHHDFVHDFYFWLEIVAGLFAVTAGVFTIPKWYRSVHGVLRKVKRVFNLIDYELQHNGGGSIKDHSEKAMNFASQALTVSKDTDSKVDETNAKVDDLANQLHSFIATHSLEHKSLNMTLGAVLTTPAPVTVNLTPPPAPPGPHIENLVAAS